MKRFRRSRKPRFIILLNLKTEKSWPTGLYNFYKCHPDNYYLRTNLRYMKRYFFVLFAIILFADIAYAQNLDIVTSPNKQISVRCRLDDAGSLTYVVLHNGKEVLEPSQLGIT